MSTLVISYNSLHTVATNASNLAKKAEEYANSLTSQVTKKFDGITGGSSTNTTSAKYYVSSKVKELQRKKEMYYSFSKQVSNFVETARQVDKEVAHAIANNQEKFLQKHENLRIDDWKAIALNFLVDLKNSCPLFEMIGNISNDVGTSLSGLRDNIKYWYKYEGGQEMFNFAMALGGAAIALMLFAASFPFSSFFSVIAMIGAGIEAINAVTNVVTSYCAMTSDDPAWAKVYGDQTKLSDVLRQHKFKNSIVNRGSYGLATLFDSVELFCDAVNIVESVKNFRSKFNFIQNFIDKDRGLISYMKTDKQTDVKHLDLAGNIIGTKTATKANSYDVIKREYTVSSIWNGMRAYVMNKPIDGQSGEGIRTILNKNFVTDFKDWKNSIFNVTGWKDTFKYTVTDGGRISYSEWKNTLNFSSVKNTIKFNLKNNSVRGMFAKGIEWKERRQYISSTAKSLKKFNDVSTKMENIFTGKSTIPSELKTVTIDYFDSTKIIDKTQKLTGKFVDLGKNTYIYKHIQISNGGMVW